MNLKKNGLMAIILVASASTAFAESGQTLPSSAVPPAGVGRQHTVDTNTTAATPSNLQPGASKEGVAHNTGDVANGPTPPRPTGSGPTAPRNSPPSSGTIVPGPAASHGDTEVGNSSEHNGMIGSAGAGASATMQGGHTSNR